MNSQHERSKLFQRYIVVTGALMLTFMLVWLLSRRNAAPSASSEASATDNSQMHEDANSGKVQPRDNRHDVMALNSDSPLKVLSPRLKAIVRDLETRATFMGSPFGFTNEEKQKARTKCEGLVESLNAEEVGTLIRFYRSPETKALPIVGDELVGAMLYERWGEVAGDGAMRAVESWIVERVSENQRDVDLTDPFQMDPDFYDVGKVFSGWAQVNSEESERGFERMLEGLREKGVSIEEFKCAILDEFPELNQQWNPQVDIPQTDPSDP